MNSLEEFFKNRISFNRWGDMRLDLQIDGFFFFFRENII